MIQFPAFDPEWHTKLVTICYNAEKRWMFTWIILISRTSAQRGLIRVQRVRCHPGGILFQKVEFPGIEADNVQQRHHQLFSLFSLAIG